jgi:hypothetical protein
MWKGFVDSTSLASSSRKTRLAVVVGDKFQSFGKLGQKKSYKKNFSVHLIIFLPEKMAGDLTVNSLIVTVPMVGYSNPI